VIFWPLYVPILLSREPDTQPTVEPARPAAPPDDLALAIVQVDAELEAALRSLDGWAEDVLAREKGRFHDLRSAWIGQAQRIREMDRLLERPEYASDPVPLLDGPQENGLAERLRASQQVVHRNRARLREVRERTLADLLATLAWVRELVSMIQLAKFTGAPASRAEELVAQIAAAVEGLSAMSWHDESSGQVAAPP
jgi:hypothetical protein